ncbi:hypothetical protein CRE_23038 [Caenorhabditis remanei]|uniref:Uncharacterized protein n=1 Tax=Caenorhabditis remanei TaxID=31234 RepID=E3N4H4_CAERE|nr:hypothetical protein CRE_23038 [Caenorhabditis remanei]
MGAASKRKATPQLVWTTKNGARVARRETLGYAPIPPKISKTEKAASAKKAAPKKPAKAPKTAAKKPPKPTKIAKAVKKGIK